jgi:hypothetical protein
LVCSQLVSYFIKISSLCYGINYLYMNVFHCVFIYHLIESLEYVCLMVIVVHVIKSFILCILIDLKGYQSKRKKSKGEIEGCVPRPVGGWGVLQATSFVFQLQLEGGSNPLVSQATTRGKI